LGDTQPSAQTRWLAFKTRKTHDKKCWRNGKSGVVSQPRARHGIPANMNAAIATTPTATDLCPRSDLCPLNRIRAGTPVRIKQLCVAPEMGSRLREIGLGEEQIIQPLTGQTSIICRVCNARLAISSQLAENILVEAVALDIGVPA
jgi:Fe2+ transport system protein FeoA